ncbi:tetratricopeptide repeat protein [Streptomyces sp. NPDC006476]|uniref:tetratricopeptide repeat protein n=1 Tax=Streptomyces sp. NPDC006476 TaxID=3157175 RepID=UPI0033AD1B4B
MTEQTTAPGWAERIAAAERAVRGDPQAAELLRAYVNELDADVTLLNTPGDARDFAYFVTLLRELDLAGEVDTALAVAEFWIGEGRVPAGHRCVVHNRLATVLVDAGGEHLDEALAALETALETADTPAEQARTYANLAVCVAEQGKWPLARAHAQRAQTLSRSLPEAGQRLELLLRAVSVLFLAARQDGIDHRTRDLARELEELCRRQMDRWGDDHPRALEALVLMASARHETATLDGDVESMERLTDVLERAAQRSATTLGMRHPRAKAVRSALTRAHETTRRARAALLNSAAPAPAPAPTSAPRSQPAPTQHMPLVLELLVHGIDGATPEQMLDDPRVVQVGGDDIAALHRRAEDVDAERRPEDYGDRPVPEAYSWSRLAPGSSPGRVLQYLLLPFMIVNLAHWMRPPARGLGRTIRVHGLLVRLAALSLTIMVVTAICELSMDLAAWQCAGSAACAGGQRFWMGFLAAGWWSQPGRRLAVGSLVPCVFIALLWRLSQRNWNIYESQQPPYRAIAPDDPYHRQPLAKPGFWYGQRLVARLTAMHTTAGLLTVAWLLVAAPYRFDRQQGGPPALNVVGQLLYTLILVDGLAVVWVVCRRGPAEDRIDMALDRRLVSAGPAAVVLVLCLGYAMWSRPGWDSVGRLPGSDTMYSGLLLAQGLAVVALAGAGQALFRSAPAPNVLLRGLAPATAVMLACSLYNMMGAGAVQGLADWLGNRSSSGPPHDAITGPPPLVTWQMSALPVLLAVLLVLAGWVYVRSYRLGRALRAQIHADFPDEPRNTLRSRQIAAARARAAVTDAIPLLLGAVATALLLLTAASLTGAYVTGAPPGHAAAGLPQPVDELSRTLKAIGSWLIAAGIVVFLNSSRRATRAPTSRSLLGIVWDLGTFWPRAAHPFARLCYSERAVPDLTWRMTTWCRQTGGRIVVSAHSQGSVLAVAAIWQLPPADRRRIALLTYGSPLERLYGRLFPSYFGHDALFSLHREIDSWRNLWRSTDPIGGPVRVGGGDEGPEVDRQLRDPLSFGRSAAYPLSTPIRGHNNYQGDPAFAEVRQRMVARTVLPPTIAQPSLDGS